MMVNRSLGRADKRRLTWLITGASSGLGAAIARVAVARGDSVVGTARQSNTVKGSGSANFSAWSLDFSNRSRSQGAIRGLVEAHPVVDVLVNNAGYGLLGAFEEMSDGELREAFDVNLFGGLDLIRAYLPGMRARGWGRVVQMSSITGVTSGAGGAGYAGPKAALEAVSDALAAEVEQFGVGVTVVEPGAFRTDFTGRSLRRSEPLPHYESSVGRACEAFAAAHGTQRGDPELAAQAITEAVLSSDPPRRLPLGPDAYATLRAHHRARLAELETLLLSAASTDLT